MKSQYKLGTRGSPLALWQAHYVQEKLKTAGISTEIQVIKTSGDRMKDKALSEIGGKGVFVKELEEALLSQQIDLAVHSLKDLPAEISKPFALPSYLPRHPAEDVMIFSPQWQGRLKDLSRESWHLED